MDDFHVSAHQVRALQATLRAMPFSDSVPMNVEDVVGADGLVRYLKLLSEALADVREEAGETRFQLRRHADFLDGLRWVRRALDQEAGENLCAP